MALKNDKCSTSSYDKFPSTTGLLPDNPNNVFRSGTNKDNRLSWDNHVYYYYPILLSHYHGIIGCLSELRYNKDNRLSWQPNIYYKIVLMPEMSFCYQAAV